MIVADANRHNHQSLIQALEDGSERDWMSTIRDTPDLSGREESNEFIFNHDSS